MPIREQLDRHWPQGLLAAAALATLVRTLHRLYAAAPFTTDDAYISLRYARHLAQGAGVVWNLEGPAVEGYSNFSFVLLGAASLSLGVEPVLVLKSASALALTGSCVLLYLLGRGLVGPYAALAPVILLTGYRGTIWWTVSGLETAVYQCLLLGATAAFVVGLGYPMAGPASSGARARRAPLAVAGILVFAASLTRFEGPIIGICLGSVLLGRASLRAWRARQQGGSAGAGAAAAREDLLGLVVLAGVAAAPYALYLGWRISHFGALIPNSYACKTSYAGPSAVLVGAFVRQTAPFLLLSALAVAVRRDPRVLALALPPVAYVGLLWQADPLVGHQLRHFLPVYGSVLLLGILGLQALVRAPRFSRDAGLAVMILALVSSGFAPKVSSELRAHALAYRAKAQERMRLGRWVDATLESRGWWVMGGRRRRPLRHGRERPRRLLPELGGDDVRQLEPIARAPRGAHPRPAPRGDHPGQQGQAALRRSGGGLGTPRGFSAVRRGLPKGRGRRHGAPVLLDVPPRRPSQPAALTRQRLSPDSQVLGARIRNAGRAASPCKSRRSEMNSRILTLAALLAVGVGPAPSVQAALIDDLVAYYTFDDALNLGSDDADVAGSIFAGAGTYDGTPTNGPTATSGRVNGGIELDHLSSQYVRVDGFPLLTPYTVQAWIAPDSLAGDQNAVQYGENYGLYEIRSSSGGTVTNVMNDGAWQFYDYDSAYQGSFFASGWHHVAMTYDGSFVRVYVDGSLDSTTPQTGTPTLGSGRWLGIGVNGGWGSSPFDGQIDEVAIWARPLSDAEINSLYNGGAGRSMIPEPSTGILLVLGCALIAAVHRRS